MFDHIVVVVMENHGYEQVIGSRSAPWLNSIAQTGANLTNAHGETHPSEPNYIALYSGSTYGVTSDTCNVHLPGPSLGAQLVGAGRTFAAYSEGLPSVDWPGCSSGRYARKHNPLPSFRDTPAGASRPFTDFTSDYSRLPSVALVVPDLCNDTHDCPIATGDAWLRDHLGGYLTWATTHNSLLVVTYDEDEGRSINRIPTVLAGAHVRQGQYAEQVDHVRLLRTIEQSFGLPGLAGAAGRQPLTVVWQ